MRAMLPPPPPSGPAVVVIAVAAVLLVVAAAAVQDQYSWPAAGVGDEAAGAVVVAAPYCAGGVEEECVDAGAGEARRELGYGGYISYDAMQRDSVPCSYRGASYYNCRPGGEANPYSRGCSAIAQCRG
ncbi:hypothetical protein GUJ93_ZPchr0007g3889 [Zizania palustris]|uniref:Rapid alkalinization factor-like n=1 Tax=Zizania palustris TaxID=103762 RepID=A0A8J5W4N0_ZIZPA|nr:hypothetical protein GUJ93_ZPchr0007g3889 [Zizania palustris]